MDPRERFLRPALKTLPPPSSIGEIEEGGPFSVSLAWTSPFQQTTFFF